MTKEQMIQSIRAMQREEFGSRMCSQSLRQKSNYEIELLYQECTSWFGRSICQKINCTSENTHEKLIKGERT